MQKPAYCHIYYYMAKKLKMALFFIDAINFHRGC